MRRLGRSAGSWHGQQRDAQSRATRAARSSNSRGERRQVMIPSDLDGLARSLLVILSGSAVRAGVIAGIIGAAVFVLRGKGAALHLKAWTAVLLASLALPALVLVVPVWHWDIPILPQPPATLFADSSGVS